MDNSNELEYDNEIEYDNAMEHGNSMEYDNLMSCDDNIIDVELSKLESKMSGFMLEYSSIVVSVTVCYNYTHIENYQYEFVDNEDDQEKIIVQKLYDVIDNVSDVKKIDIVCHHEESCIYEGTLYKVMTANVVYF